MQGFACDRCGTWEVGPGGVTEPDTWVHEGSADAHLCPTCVIEEPAWTAHDVDALHARFTRALIRSMELHETFRAVQAQAVQVRRRLARRPSMDVNLPAMLGSVASGRRLVTTFAEESAAQLDDLALLTSELVTNALMHAGLSPSGQVRLQVRLDNGSVQVAVGDQGTGVEAGSVPIGAGLDGGHGLQIVDALADGWGSGPGRVWFRLGRSRAEPLLRPVA